MQAVARLEPVLLVVPLAAVALGASGRAAARTAFLVASAVCVWMFVANRILHRWHWRRGSGLPAWATAAWHALVPATGMVAGASAVLAASSVDPQVQAGVTAAGWCCIAAGVWARLACCPNELGPRRRTGESPAPRFAAEDALPAPVLDVRGTPTRADAAALEDIGWAVLHRGGRHRLVHAHDLRGLDGTPDLSRDWWQTGRRVANVDGGVRTGDVDLVTCGGLAAVVVGEEVVGVLVAPGVPVPTRCLRRHVTLQRHGRDVDGRAPPRTGSR